MIKNNLLDIESLVNKLNPKKGDYVADFGCGSFGFFTFMLADKVGRDGVVYAVDIMKDHLDSVKRRASVENLKQVVTVWSDLDLYNATDIKSTSLDHVYIINTLHQSSDFKSMLKEVSRLMKKGAKALVVDWLDDSIVPNVKKVAIDQLSKTAEELGLKIEETFDAGNYHYGIVLEKQKS